ncbi:hypothetical protein EON65_29370 [archaeon]|nr:MAG: hypothetical protein EON65_29370 [archaeon]
MLFDLPAQLSHEVCTNWITTPDLVRLDSANVCYQHRSAFLSMLRTKYFCTEGDMKTASINQAFQWVMSRKTKFNNFAVVDGALKTLPWLQMGFFFRNLRSFKVNLVQSALGDHRMIAALRRIFLNSCSTLEEFDGTGCLVLDDLFAGMKWPQNVSFPKLKTLKLSGCRLSLPNLVKLLQQCPNVEVVDFSGSSVVTDAYLKALGAHCRVLKSLDLSSCAGFTGEALLPMLSNCSSICYVAVKNCSQLSAESVDSLLKLPREVCCVL